MAKTEKDTSKLSFMLLTEMISGDKYTTDGHIAAYLLDHIDEAKELTVREIAEKLNVSISSISRFCRNIGLETFAELKELLAKPLAYFKVYSQAPTYQQQKLDFVNAVKSSLDRLYDTLDMEKLYKLARDIRRYTQVYLFGMLKSESVAMNLQNDLAKLGKATFTKMRLVDQNSYLASAGKDDLIVIFSIRGAYFDYVIPPGYRQNPKDRPKVYLITSNANIVPPRFYDELIWFDSDQGQTAHPYQMQLIADLIAQCYAHVLQEEPQE